MNCQQRLLFYLGTDKEVPHPDMNKFSIKDLTKGIHTHDTVYDLPLFNLLVKTKNFNNRFSFSRGDVITEDQQNNWTLSKNRCEGNTSSVLLRSYNFDRHWGNYYNKPKDIPFEKKKNVVFWRGVSTGSSKHFSAKNWDPRPANRFTLVENWFNKTNDIDVGFSFIHRDWLKPKYQKYVKGSCDVNHF